MIWSFFRVVIELGRKQCINRNRIIVGTPQQNELV